MDPRNGLGHQKKSVYLHASSHFFSTLTVIYLFILALFYYIFLKINNLNEDKNSTWATYHIADIY